ncbi:MAG: hypothetical protein AAFX50_07070, partial [Acidobacteriota bacterium]
VASRGAAIGASPDDAPRTTPARRRLASLLDDGDDPDLLLAEGTARRYRHAVDVVERGDPGAVSGCFTSAYGRSPVRSGSYLATSSGPRFFAPHEVLRLLGFPADYRLPAWASTSPKGRKKAWRLAGNSLSLPAVRHALRGVPELGSGFSG